MQVGLGQRLKYNSPITIVVTTSIQMYGNYHHNKSPILPVCIESISQEVGCSMGDQAISLHLPHTQSALSGPALHRLPRQHRHGSAGAGVDLIVHQMLQTLYSTNEVGDIMKIVREKNNGIYLLFWTT
jgi:hypothetical protein